MTILLPNTVEELLHAMGAIDAVRKCSTGLQLEAVVQKPEHRELVAASRLFYKVHDPGSNYTCKIEPTREEARNFGTEFAKGQAMAAKRILHDKDFEVPISEFNYGMTATQSFYNEVWSPQFPLSPIGDIRLVGPKTPISRELVKEWKTHLRKEYKWYGNEQLILLNLPLEEEDEVVEAMESYRGKGGKPLFGGLFFSLEQEEMEVNPLAYTSLISLASFVIGKDWEVTAAGGLGVPSIRIPVDKYDGPWFSIQAPTNAVYLSKQTPLALVPRAIEQHLIS